MTIFEKTWQFGINYLPENSSLANSQKNQFWWLKAFLKGDLPQRTLSKITSGDAKTHVEVANTTQDNHTQGLWWCVASSDGNGGTAGTTTITSGSNGVNINTFTGSGTLNVSSTTGFATSGVIYVQTTASTLQPISYTNVSGGNSFTGCNAPNATGTFTTGNAVFDGQDRWGTQGDGYLWRGGVSTNSPPTNTGSTASFTSGATIAGAVRMTGLANMTANDVGNFMTITNADAYNLSPTNTPFKIVNFVSSSSVDIYNPFGQPSDSHNGSVAWTERNAYIPPSVRTTIASGSNNTALPTGTINVASTTNFAGSGTIIVITNAGAQIVSYTSTAGGTQFTGCTGGNGTMLTGFAVYQVSYQNQGSTTTMINATSGTNHSWMLLMSPLAIGPYYYTLDWNSATVQNGSFSFAKNIPSGGSATTAPTASDTTTFSNTQWSNTSNVTTVATHAILSTDGYFNIFFTRNNGGGFIEGAMIFQVLANTKSVDQYPFIYFHRFNNNSESLNGFYSGNATTCANWMSRSFNGVLSRVGSAATGLVPVFITYDSNNTILGINNSVGNISYGDYSDSLYDDAPIYIVDNQLGVQTLKGRLVDIKQAPLIVTGFVEPNPSAPASMHVCSLWFPFNLTPIL